MTSPVGPELQAKITEWRRKAADGTMTLDEMKEAIRAMRAGRVTAATASENSTRRTKAKAAIPSADDMLSELEDL